MADRCLKYFTSVKDDKVFVDINDGVACSMEEFEKIIKSDKHIRKQKKRGREGNSIISSFAIRDTITAEVYCQPLYWATIGKSIEVIHHFVTNYWFLFSDISGLSVSPEWIQHH